MFLSLTALRIYAAITIVALIAACLVWLDQRAYKRGVERTTAVYLKRDAETAARAADRVRELENAAREVERDRAAALVAVSTDFQTRLSHAQAENARMRAALLRGDVRLRFPVAVPGAGDRSPPAETGGTACRCDAPAAGELPREVALDLWQLAADADVVAEQLAACQAVVRSDRGQ